MSLEGNQGQGLSSWGRKMTYAAWGLALVMLTWLFQGMLDHQENPNSNPESRVSAQGLREVVLQRNRAGHYVADGRINGEPATFLLDTGATDVALPESLAERLGLKPLAYGQSQTAAGRVSTWTTRLDRVSLGAIELNDVRASVLPSMEGDGVLLGMSFLKHLELIQRGETLILRRTQ